MSRVYGAANEFLAKKYGGVFDTKATVVTVGTVRTTVAAPDPERVLLVFVNLEPAGDMFLLPDNASLAAGAMALPPGERMEWNVDLHGNMPSVGWVAQHGAGGNMLVIKCRREVVAVPGGIEV